MRRDRSFQPASFLIIATSIMVVAFVSGCQTQHGHYYAGGSYYSGRAYYPHYGYYNAWWPARYYYGPHGRSYYYHRTDYYRHGGGRYYHRGDGRGKDYHRGGQRPPQYHQGRPQMRPAPQRIHGDGPHRIEQPRTQHRQNGLPPRYAPQQRQRGDHPQLGQPQQTRGRDQLRSPRDYRPPQSHMGGQGGRGRHNRR